MKLFVSSNSTPLLIFLFHLIACSTQTQNALYFDGKNDHVSIKGVDFVPGDDISVSFWFKASAFPVSDIAHENVVVIFSKAICPDNKDIALELEKTGTKTYLRGWVANNLDRKETFFHGSTELSLNTWYHFAVTFDNSENRISLYQDGVLVDEIKNATSDFGPERTDISIGNWVGKDGGYNFNGLVDEVRIWKSVRTKQQISDNMFVELDDPENIEDLVGYYQFNQTSGDILHDNSKYNNIGILNMENPTKNWTPTNNKIGGN